ncbi:MAG: tetratricopeptide repeat protein [Candidatus Kapaibacteriota bacterium]
MKFVSLCIVWFYAAAILAFSQQTTSTKPLTQQHLKHTSSQRLSPIEEELQRRVTPKISKLDFRGALNEINFMIAGDSANPTLYNVRAMLHLQLYNVTQAVQDYDKIIALQPKNIDAYQSRAQLRFEQLGDNVGAVQDLTQVVGLDSANPSVWYSRGAVYQAMQKFDEARKDYGECLRVGNSDNALALTQRGFCAMKLKQTTDAMNDFNAAIKAADSLSMRSPAMFEAWFYRGSLHLQRRKFAEAIFDFDAALRLKDQSGEVYYLRGYAKMLSGRTQDGCIDMSQAKELKYAAASDLIEQHCDVVGNLDSLRRYTMPTVTVTAGRTSAEIAITDSRRLLGRVQSIVANPTLQQQALLPSSAFAFRNPPGMMSPFDCNKQRLEMMRPSQINIGCVAQILQEELRKVSNGNVRVLVENIMNTANDLYILETTASADDNRSTQDVNNNQAALVRLRIADQFRELNEFLEKMQNAKPSQK